VRHLSSLQSYDEHKFEAREEALDVCDRMSSLVVDLWSVADAATVISSVVRKRSAVSLGPLSSCKIMLQSSRPAIRFWSVLEILK
jgi:hypothetical protein